MCPSNPILLYLSSVEARNQGPQPPYPPYQPGNHPRPQTPNPSCPVDFWFRPKSTLLETSTFHHYHCLLQVRMITCIYKRMHSPGNVPALGLDPLKALEHAANPFRSESRCSCNWERWFRTSADSDAIFAIVSASIAAMLTGEKIRHSSPAMRRSMTCVATLSTNDFRETYQERISKLQC